MFTAANARSLSQIDSVERNKKLDERIQREVEEAIRDGRKKGLLRVYLEDWFFDSIEEELTRRGFHSIEIPHITLKGDVSFSWASEDDSDD